MYVTSTGRGDSILSTGAISDYGAGVSTDASGKPTLQGAFEHVKLSQGGFVVDSTGFNNKINRVKPKLYPSTCEYSIAGSGPGTLSKGTGAYAGISGTLKITLKFIGYATRFKSGAHKGQCNFANNGPTAASYQSLTAAGTVKFS